MNQFLLMLKPATMYFESATVQLSLGIRCCKQEQIENACHELRHEQNVIFMQSFSRMYRLIMTIYKGIKNN